MDADNCLIRYFKERYDKKIFKGDGSLIYEKAKRLLRPGRLKGDVKDILKRALYQMEIFSAKVCIPSYYGDDLLGVLLLGEKKNNKKFDKKEIDFFTALASDVSMAIRNAQLFQELTNELDRRKRLFIHTTVALAAAIDAKDHYTHGHTSRVTNIALLIARKLSQSNKVECNDKFMEDLHYASLLHDIGKIGIPETILNKQGPLNDDEWRRIQEHPVVGVTILQPIKELADSIMGVKYHHEKFDGTGYPEGLKGEKIPLIAAIITVADSYDAMTSDRPYRRGFSKEEAIQEIKRNVGKQFNPQVVNALMALHEEKKI
jgi:HD-GYP domain-containing protein (c-di-GMP phosphodiesterase class II)